MSRWKKRNLDVPDVPADSFREILVGRRRLAMVLHSLRTTINYIHTFCTTVIMQPCKRFNRTRSACWLASCCQTKPSQAASQMRTPVLYVPFELLFLSRVANSFFRCGEGCTETRTPHRSSVCDDVCWYENVYSKLPVTAFASYCVGHRQISISSVLPRSLGLTSVTSSEVCNQSYTLLPSWLGGSFILGHYVWSFALVDHVWKIERHANRGDVRNLNSCYILILW